MEDIKILFEIQNARVKKKHFEKQNKVLPQVKELKELKTEIEQNQAELHKLKSEIEVYKKNLSKEQVMINIIKDKAGLLSEHLYSGEITNIKELENAKKNLEVEQLKITKLEDKALLVMEKIYGTENKIKVILKDLEIKKTRFRDLNRDYISQKENILKSIQEIDSGLENARQGVRQNLLETFEVLCKRYDNGIGISLLKNGICSGCHMSVSFDLLKKAKNVNGEIICDICGRWLIPE